MKYLQASLIAAILAVLGGCGAGHPTLTGINISPENASASSANHQQVVFNAQGTLSDNGTRQLTVADGLSWSTSNSAIASIGGSDGVATCHAPGTVTITATAPANLQLTFNNGVHNTSNNVSGTATLICT